MHISVKMKISLPVVFLSLFLAVALLIIFFSVTRGLKSAYDTHTQVGMVVQEINQVNSLVKDGILSKNDQ